VEGDHFRKRAAGLRGRADLATDPEIKAQLLGLAVEYEQLAEQADKLARATAPSRNRPS